LRQINLVYSECSNINPDTSTKLIDHPWLRRYAKLLCLLVLGLILKGALVTSNNAGLAVPDWPTTFGENMFTFHPSKWRGIIFYEHVHRLYASLVGALTVILAVWLWFTHQPRWVRILGIIAVGLVVAQGILGGLTVLFLLPVAISSAHAVLAQTFLLVLVAIAYSQSLEFQARARALNGTGDRRVFRLAIWLLGAIYLQLFLGAVMRHSEAGLAVLDFPTTAGHWFPWISKDTLERANQMRADFGYPPLDLFALAVHILHRCGAVVVAGLVIALAVCAAKFRSVSGEDRKIWYGAYLVLGLTVIQGMLGIFTVLTERDPWVASLHVFVGASLLIAVGVVLLRGHRDWAHS